jgi:hypothetical protein
MRDSLCLILNRPRILRNDDAHCTYLVDFVHIDLTRLPLATGASCSDKAAQRLPSATCSRFAPSLLPQLTWSATLLIRSSPHRFLCFMGSMRHCDGDISIQLATQRDNARRQRVPLVTRIYPSTNTSRPSSGTTLSCRPSQPERRPRSRVRRASRRLVPGIHAQATTDSAYPERRRRRRRRRALCDKSKGQSEPGREDSSEEEHKRRAGELHLMTNV